MNYIIKNEQGEIYEVCDSTQDLKKFVLKQTVELGDNRVEGLDDPFIDFAQILSDYGFKVEMVK